MSRKAPKLFGKLTKVTSSAPALNHWKFKEEHIQDYCLRIRYSALPDAYYLNEDLTTPVFQPFHVGLTQNSKMMYRMVEYDWRMVYLSREPIHNDETLVGVAEWDFNLPFTLITAVKIKATHTLFSNGISCCQLVAVNTLKGTVEWHVSVDGEKYKEVGLGKDEYIDITSDLKELSKGETLSYFLLKYSQGIIVL
jgi:hypothetical protein